MEQGHRSFLVVSENILQSINDLRDVQKRNWENNWITKQQCLPVISAYSAFTALRKFWRTSEVDHNRNSSPDERGWKRLRNTVTKSFNCNNHRFDSSLVNKPTTSVVQYWRWVFLLAGAKRFALIQLVGQSRKSKNQSNGSSNHKVGD